MQYNLWFLLLGLLAVPFLPFRFFKLSEMFIIVPNVKTEAAIGQTLQTNITDSQNRIKDFALSVSRETPSILGYLLLAIWLSGMIAMLILLIRSFLGLHGLKKFRVTASKSKVQRLYPCCLHDTGITKHIPVYSTAYLKSPVIVGFWKPCIYLPIHLISDDNETDIRYMLLHELQHYKHKDGIANALMNLAGIVYWFHPLVWYVLKEMRIDREIACDTSVLKLLKSEDYVSYGNTLINFAEKISSNLFPFASGISGSMKQMKRRILNIASYQRPTLQKKLKVSLPSC